MKAHWDEIFLKLKHQQELQKQLEMTENDESWMLITTEHAIEQIPSGLLTFPDGEQMSFRRVQRPQGDITMHLPVNWLPLTPMQQARSRPGSWNFQDPKEGVVFGVYQSEQELLPEQVEMYQQGFLSEMSRTQSSLIRLEETVMPLQDTNVNCYTNVFPLMPDPCLQIGFIRSWRGKALSMNCQFKLADAPKWTSIVHAIFHTATWLQQNG